MNSNNELKWVVFFGIMFMISLIGAEISNFREAYLFCTFINLLGFCISGYNYESECKKIIHFEELKERTIN